MTRIPQESVESIIHALIKAVATESDREGLAQTPRRVASFYEEFFALGEEDFQCTTFDAEGATDLVLVKDMPFYSLCEHHLVPFFGKVSLGYHPQSRIVGLSKIPRIVQKFASRLQNQERFTHQIAEYFIEHVFPQGVGVRVEARHLCTEMRGIRSIGNSTVTLSLHGTFKSDPPLREEFLAALK
jgi:GTP cyclohydrolase IA